MATDQNDQLLEQICDRLGEIIRRLPEPPPAPTAGGPQPISEPVKPAAVKAAKKQPGRTRST
jgi:hypothetical protein